MVVQNLLSRHDLKGNWVDIIFIGLLAYFLITNTGFVDTLFDVLGFLFSLFFSYQFYTGFGHILSNNFSLPPGLSDAAGFFIAWLLSEVFLSIVFAFLLSKFLQFMRVNIVNRALGFLPAIVQACLLYLFFVSLIFALPVRGQIKETILQSRTGPLCIQWSSQLEKAEKGVFGEAVSESLNFLTVEPSSGESVNLGFKIQAGKLPYDPQSEATMVQLVNKERTSRGVPALAADTRLRVLARSYGEIMFENGFFSHTSQVDGSTPADRANKANIQYYVIGENLAYAPDVYLAHQGLMNSPSHRANILNAEYHKVGIGVIDGGIYGKMFVQEFTN